MSFSKQFTLPDVGSLTVSEAAGVVTIAVTGAQSLGGGQAAGVATGQASAQVAISAKQMVDLSLAFLEARFPSASSLLADVKAAVDLELSAL